MPAHSFSAPLPGANIDDKASSEAEQERFSDLEKNPTYTDKETLEPSSNESATSNDENIVWWDDPVDQDPENPMNWPASKKWGTIAVISSITFIT
jgi:hypothetical protein